MQYYAIGDEKFSDLIIVIDCMRLHEIAIYII